MPVLVLSFLIVCFVRVSTGRLDFALLAGFFIVEALGWWG